jgi:hypothetical protein
VLISPWKGFPNHLPDSVFQKTACLFLFDRTGRVLAHPTEETIKTVVTQKGELSIEEVRFLKGEESSDPVLKAVIDSYASPKRHFG